MNKSNVKYIVLLCSTYRYLRISISFVTPTGDLNKYKFAISISMCISLFYKFMKNSNICYCISILLYAYCRRVLLHVYMHKLYASH